MKRRSRLLRFAKWGGVVVSGLIAIVAVASLWWSLGWSSATGHTSIAVNNAGLYFESIRRNVVIVQPMGLGWTFGKHKTRFEWLGGWSRPFPFMWELSIALWMPFAVAAILTAYLFRLDRPPPPGHCPCGYDLRGNVSGTCPECGFAPLTPKGDQNDQ